MPKIKWFKLFMHLGILYMAVNIFLSWWNCRDQLCVGDQGYYETDGTGRYTVDQWGKQIPATGK